MLQQDFIAKLLEMEHMDFEDVSVSDREIVLKVSMRRRATECPACGAFTDRVHDYRLQRVKDIPIQGKHVILEYRKRRYACACGKRFYEKNCYLPRFHRITNRLAFHCMDLLKENRSRKAIAMATGVSESTVCRWMNLTGQGAPARLPEVLSIDEFRGNTDHGKFQAILTDPCHSRVLDVLPTCSEPEIRGYLSAFRNRNDVKYFVTDMRKEYVRTAKDLFPQAKIVIDRFHVVRYCCWALENVRKRVQAKLLPEQRKYFKRSRRLLLAHMDSLNEDGKAAVERMLLYDRDLREAYLLKEKFYEFMDSADSGQARERLKAFRVYAHVADIREFGPCLTMLDNWERYILNAFDCPYSNGFTEGCNNRIKSLKRTAFGYRSFRNFRNRILLVMNG